MSEARELLACPFCGDQGQPALVQGGGIEWAQVECVNPDCGAVGPTPATEAEAIAAWNTRPHPGRAETIEEGVTQEDREAAAGMLRKIDLHFYADEAAEGQGDQSAVVQAFRNHRLSAIRSLNKDA